MKRLFYFITLALLCTACEHKELCSSIRTPPPWK